jgi:hypothetical protein
MCLFARRAHMKMGRIDVYRKIVVGSVNVGFNSSADF